MTFIISSFFAPGIIGNISWKSPPNKKGLLQNGTMFSIACKCERMLERDLSNVSKQYLWFVGASSHIIKLVFSINVARCVFFFIGQTYVSVTNNKISNLEWSVLPPSNNNDAILDDVTAKMILPLDLSLLIIVPHKKVFQVPPWL